MEGHTGTRSKCSARYFFGAVGHLAERRILETIDVKVSRDRVGAVLDCNGCIPVVAITLVAYTADASCHGDWSRIVDCMYTQQNNVKLSFATS